MKDVEGIAVAQFKMLLRRDIRLYVVLMLMNWVIFFLLRDVDNNNLAFVTTWKD
jgi:hypothetical protein